MSELRRRLLYAKPKEIPYDAEVEYLESSDGKQYIDTGIYPTELDLELEYEGAKYLSFGWIYGSAAYNTWIGLCNNVIYSSTWVSRFTLPSFGSNWSVCKFKMDEGFFKNDTLLQSFSASLGNTPINDVPLLLFAVFDKRINTISSNVNDNNGKIKWCKIRRNGNLLRDFIPVQKNGIGYLYDKISGRLFSNQGTGEFIIGGG